RPYAVSRRRHLLPVPAEGRSALRHAVRGRSQRDAPRRRARRAARQPLHRRRDRRVLGGLQGVRESGRVPPPRLRAEREGGRVRLRARTRLRARDQAAGPHDLSGRFRRQHDFLQRRRRARAAPCLEPHSRRLLRLAGVGQLRPPRLYRERRADGRRHGPDRPPVDRIFRDGFLTSTRKGRRMQMHKVLAAVVGLWLGIGAAIAQETAPTEDAGVLERRRQIDERAEATLEKLFAAQSAVRQLYDRASGYAVFTATKAGFIVTGGGGTGVAVDKSTGQRTYMRMGTGGIGL